MTCSLLLDVLHEDDGMLSPPMEVEEATELLACLDAASAAAKEDVILVEAATVVDYFFHGMKDACIARLQ